jgi:oligosaccharide repeat unit polymerase
MTNVAASWVDVALPALALLMLALASRAVQRSWLAPGAFIALVWVVYFAAGAYGMVIQGQPAGLALWVVPGLVAAFVAGAGLMQPFGHAQAVPGRAPWVAHRVRLRLLVLALVLGAAYAVPGILAFAGYGLGDILSLSQLQSVVGAMSNLRYGEQIDEPLAVRVATGLLYTSAPFAGLLFVWRKRWYDTALAVAPLAIALLYVLVTTSKTPLMMCLFLFGATFMATKVAGSGGQAQLFSWQVVVFLALVTVLGLLYVSFLIELREGKAPSDGFVGPGIRTYFLSHLAAFSIWYERTAITPQPLGWGQFTFSGLLGRLGLAPRAFGIYADVVMPTTGDITNLYSAFRGLLQDFGAAGATAIMAASGAVAQALYNRLCFTHTFWAMPVLALVYFTVLLSFLYSPFIFNNIIAACALFALGVPWMVRQRPPALDSYPTAR